jgi:hypothetical protein
MAIVNVDTGNELRDFFLELLAGTNLIDYYAQRDIYIDRRVRHPDRDRVTLEPEDPGVQTPFLGTDAQALLRSSALREIEDSIRLVTGSGKAVPIWVVSPPMSSDS